MSTPVTVKQILKPKKNGSGGTTIIRGSGYASTTTNNNNNTTSSDSTLTTLSAATINATQGTFDVVKTNSFTSNNGSVVNLDVQTLNVNGMSTLQDLDVHSITQHGNYTMYPNTYVYAYTYSYSYDEIPDKSYTYEYYYVTETSWNTFDIKNSYAYFGSYNFFDELTGGEASSITSYNITSSNITTEYLTVTKSAHFFELIIDKIKAAGGSVLFTPADGFIIDDVVENIASDYYRLYWRACSEIAEGTEGQTISEVGQTLTEKISTNMWQAGDQARCQTFNLGQFSYSYTYSYAYGASNKFWWRVVFNVSSEPVVHSINGINYYCHYIDVYRTDDGNLSYVDLRSDIPAVGDEVAMIGNRNNQQRQSAIYIASSASIDRDINAPLFAEYEGINNFTIEDKKKNWIASSGNHSTPSTQIKGNIVLSSGDTVQTYVDNAVAGIQTGSQFFTNFLSFENQNINIPCLSNGTPLVNSVSTNIWCLHGQNKLNIASISSTFSALSCSYTGDTANVNLTGSSLGFLSDPTTTIPVTLTAYESGTSGTTIQYTGNLYVTKVKNGEKGNDGITPIVYELASDTQSRTLTYGNSEQSIWTINPSTFRVYINKIDASSNTPITTAATVPSGMTLFYRIYDNDTQAWSNSYANITSTFNANGYYNYSWSDSYKYGVKFYLYNEEVVGNLTTSNFDESKVYDIWDVPLLINGTDGQNGQNGTDGVNGKNIYAKMSDIIASVGQDDKLNVKIGGKLYYRDGDTVDSSYNFTGYKVSISNDNPYSGWTGDQYVANKLVSTITLDSSSSYSYSYAYANTFQYTNQISGWHTYSYVYRPTTMYVNILNPSNNPVSETINVPITFESGATLSITDSINATVRGQAGDIAALSLTAQGLRTDVDSNTGQISSLQQTANNINLTIANQNVVNDNQFKKADIPSDWLTDAWLRSPNNDNAVKRDTTVTHNGNTSVCLNMAYDTSGNVFFPIVYQYLDKEIPAGTQFMLSCYVKIKPATGQTNAVNSAFGLDIKGDAVIDPTPIGFYIDDIYKRAGDVGDSDTRCYAGIGPTEINDTNWHKITFICKTGKDIDANKLRIRLFGWHNTISASDCAIQPKFYASQPIAYIDNGADITKNINNSLYETGIDISTGVITLKADKVSFTNSAGTVSDKISIDPTTGTLNAVDGNFSGLFDAYNSTSWDEVILNAGTGQVFKIRGASSYRDVSGELLPATTATHVDLAKINIKKDADTLRSYPELTLHTSGSNTPDMTINTDGIEIDKENYNLYVGADQVNCKFPLYGTNDVSYPTISKEWQYIIGRGYNEATYTYSREISWTDDFAVITGGGGDRNNPYILPQTTFGKQLIIFNNSGSDIWIATANGDSIIGLGYPSPIGLGSSNNQRALAPKRCLTFTHSNGGNTWYITGYA